MKTQFFYSYLIIITFALLLITLGLNSFFFDYITIIDSIIYSINYEAITYIHLEGIVHPDYPIVDIDAISIQSSVRFRHPSFSTLSSIYSNPIVAPLDSHDSSCSFPNIFSIIKSIFKK